MERKVRKHCPRTSQCCTPVPSNRINSRIQTCGMKTLYNLHSFPSIIRVTESSRIMRWAGNIACTRDNKFKKILGRKGEMKTPIRTPRLRWKYMNGILENKV
jgi:hypothetical protein